MRHLFTLVWLVLSQAVCAQTSSTLARPHDPVVLTGTSLPTYVGLSPASIVGFRFVSSAWQQIPVQVDERALLDVVKPYGNLGASLGYGPSPTNLRVLFYTDAATLTGADPTPAFDADDELVFMAKDAGGRATTTAIPVGVVAGSCREIAITDPLGGLGYVYLFLSAGTLVPGAGVSYVAYSSNATSTGGFPAHLSGTNAENTTITTPRYSWHFASEWVSDELKLAVGNNVDLLDRHKNFFANGNCARHEDAFSAAENAFVTLKAGPVRVIRSYMGAVSGPLTQRTHLFYEGRHDILTDLRVHSIPGIQDAFDYSPAALGMTYRNNLNPTGVTISGTPDAVALGDISWEQVSGVPGTLSILHRRATTLTAANATFASYYDDNSTAPASNCTGDGQALGTSGVSVQFIGNVCTDPIVASGCGAASADFRTLQTTRVLYFDAAGVASTTAATYNLRYNSPLQTAVGGCSTVTALSQGSAPAAISVYPNPSAGQVSVAVGQEYQLRVYNALGQQVLAARLAAGTSQLQLREKGLFLFVFTNGIRHQSFRQLIQ